MVKGFRYVCHTVLSTDPEEDAICKVRKYAVIHIEQPFDNPFVSIPGAYHTLMDYMKVNGLNNEENNRYYILLDVLF